MKSRAEVWVLFACAVAHQDIRAGAVAVSHPRDPALTGIAADALMAEFLKRFEYHETATGGDWYPRPPKK